MDLDQFKKILTWIIIIICLALVFGVQYRAFGASGKTRTAGSIASFFHVNEIVDKWQLGVLATVASVPLSFVFLIIAYRAETFIKKLLTSPAVDGGSINAEAIPIPLIEEIIKDIPEPALPIVILVLLFLVFGAQIKFLYNRIETGVIYIAGVAQRTNSIAREFSTKLLNNGDNRRQQYEDIVNILEKRRQHKLPLAEELENSSPESKLSFQLLHLVKLDVPQFGLRESLNRAIKENFRGVAKSNENFQAVVSQDKGKNDSEDRISHEGKVNLIISKIFNSGWFRTFAAAAMFVIVCGLYVGIVPTDKEFFKEDEAIWPQAKYIGSLVQTVVQMVLATILPMVMGIVLFVRRSERGRETVIQTVTIVVIIVFFSSLLINAPFAYQQRLEIYLGIGDLQAATEQGFGGRAELVYVLSHSIVPCMAVIVLAVVDPEKTLSVWDIAVTTVLVSAGHFAAYAAFERVSGSQWGYYWHQALLSGILSASALAILRIFWWAPLQPQNVEGPGTTAARSDGR